MGWYVCRECRTEWNASRAKDCPICHPEGLDIVSLTRETIHSIAKSLLRAPPSHVTKAGGKAVVGYRVGLMKLAEALTGQTVAEADEATITAALEAVEKVPEVKEPKWAIDFDPEGSDEENEFEI